jgi:hypothetical protein
MFPQFFINDTTNELLGRLPQSRSAASVTSTLGGAGLSQSGRLPPYNKGNIEKEVTKRNLEWQVSDPP